MVTLKKKATFSSFIHSRPVLILLSALCLLLVFSIFERFTVEREMAARRAEAEGELNQLQERADALKSQVEYLKDEDGVESEIRKHFDVVRDGEQVVIIVEDDAEIAETAPGVVVEDPVEQTEKPSFWRSLFR